MAVSLAEILRHLWLRLQLRAEQRRIVEKHGEGFDRAAMAEMRYAEALSREALRIWGPADILFRCAHAAAPCTSASASPLQPCSCRACFPLASMQCTAGSTLSLQSCLHSAGPVLADLSRVWSIQELFDPQHAQSCATTASHAHRIPAVPSAGWSRRTLSCMGSASGRAPPSSPACCTPRRATRA